VTPTAAPAFEDLAAALAEARARLENRFHALAASHPEVFPRTAAGKLLRPALLLAVAGEENLRNGQAERAIELAVTVELIHLATLNHDDVLDDSPRRRRALSARETLGNKVSILLGDALLAEALEAILRVGTRRMLVAVSRAVTATLHGELVQHLSHRTIDLPERDCVRVACLKTGSLFGVAARLGAMHAGASRAAEQAAWRMGRRLGTAYQLIDDALDYGGDPAVLGKEPGSDFAQGIATLPLVLAWKNGSDSDRELLEAGFGHQGSERFAGARAVVLGSPAFSRTLEASRQQLNRARNALAELGDSGAAAKLLGVFAECEARLQSLD
jgi:octaprenyl-diphosphate synthase